MKKILSILFAFLILLSVMHINIANHYCASANATFVKITFTSELASCGMEGCDDKCAAPGNYLEEPCCNDNVSVLAVDNSSMDGCDDKCSTPDNHLEKPCCNDNVSVLAVDNNYAPSFTNFTAFAQHILQVYIVPVNFEFHSLSVINLISTSVSPPGNFLVHAVSLSKICVFLI